MRVDNDSYSNCSMANISILDMRNSPYTWSQRFEPPNTTFSIGVTIGIVVGVLVFGIVLFIIFWPRKKGGASKSTSSLELVELGISTEIMKGDASKTGASLELAELQTSLEIMEVSLISHSDL